MNARNKNQKPVHGNFSIFCWNIANPSLQRATKQALWLRRRPEDILVLTEAKRSEGCLFLEKYFRAYGYNVIFPKPEGTEFAVMIISKKSLVPSNFSDKINYLRARVASVELNLSVGQLEIIGTYVPSRDAGYEKTTKKKRFLDELASRFEATKDFSRRIFCGDLNILEPSHIPHYPFFTDWEYDFYRSLTKYQFGDAFRHLKPSTQEYSWVGRTGDGYRYDHCFVSESLLLSVTSCEYLHEPRNIKLSDHSALITNLSL
jgi:exodeoxyribonuclease-3